MPISGYFDTPFGASGTLVTVPDAIQVDGSVSYTSGWGVDYTLPASNPSYKSIPQGQMNQLFYDITSAIQVIQQGSAPAFITSAMNGGSPYSYPQYAMVTKSGVTYISNVGSNTTTPPGASWTPYTLSSGNLFTGGTTTGSANAQVLAALSPSTGFSLSNPGDTITCTAGFTNTTAATLAITSPSVSATAIQKNGSSGLTSLTGGEIVAGNIITFTVSAGGTLVLDAGLPATLFMQKANFAINIQEITSSGTYTPTAGMLYCIVEVAAAGAGGGGNGASYSSGGGGGEYRRGKFSAATIGASQSVTIGAPGTAGSSGNGGDGGNTSFGALMTANGGSHGTSGASAGGLGGSGGSGGQVAIPGQPGSSTAGGTTIGGSGGDSGGGKGTGGPISIGGAPGVNGSGYGAGGGGASANATGGAGTPGVVTITEYIA